MSPDDQAMVDAARDLAGALNGLTERLDRAERKERRLIRAVAVLGGVAVALALAIGILGWFQARENAERITSDRAQQAAFQARERTACLSTNRARTEAITLWDKVLPGGVPHTPAGRRELALLEATVARYFAAHKC